MKKIIIIFFSILIIINTPLISSIFNNLSDEGWYNYSNGTGSFTYSQMDLKGRDFEMGKRRWEAFLNSHSDTFTQEKNLYRLFKINPLAVWRLGEYIFSKKYRLPYKKWKEIENIRGSIINKSGFQDF